MDGQHAGELRVLLQHFGQEAGTRRLAAAEVVGVRQAEMKLGGTLDSRIDAGRDGAGGRRQPLDGDPAAERFPIPATTGGRGYSRTLHPQ